MMTGNISVKEEGSKLTITIDTSKDNGLTKGGNVNVASTGGFIGLQGGCSLNLNLIRKEKK